MFRVKYFSGICVILQVLQFNVHVGAQYAETPHTIVIGNVGEKAFIVDETLRSWDSSLRFCEKRGFDFLTIAPEELDRYYQFMNVYDSQGFKWRYWLGAKDLDGNGNFTWVKTGTPVSGFEIHSWRPDDEDEQDFLSFIYESSKFYKNTNNPYYYTLCESTTPINRDITHEPTPESKSRLINLGSLDNITYFGDMVTRTWFQSETYCKNQGMQLLNVTSRNQLDFLKSQTHQIKYDGWYWILETPDYDIGFESSSDYEGCPCFSFYDDHYYEHNCTHKHFTICQSFAETTAKPTGYIVAIALFSYGIRNFLLGN